MIINILYIFYPDFFKKFAKKTNFYKVVVHSSHKCTALCELCAYVLKICVYLRLCRFKTFVVQ